MSVQKQATHPLFPSLLREGKPDASCAVADLLRSEEGRGELFPLLSVFMCLISFAATPAQSQQEQGLILSGVSRNDLICLETLDKNKPVRDQLDFAGANLLTLDFKNAKTTTVKIEGNVDLWLLSGDYADAFNRAKDSSSALSVLQSPSSAFLLDIRKLYGSLFLPFADFSVGRQIISFGQGLVFSPIDVFSSVNILDLSLRRHGSDVARVRVPFGDLSGLDAIVKLTSRKQGTAAALKTYSHLGSFDLAGTGIYQGAQNEFITGVTFKGDIVVGVYGELVEHWLQGGVRSFVGMLGADYSMQNTWYFTTEYLYNERADTSRTSAPASFSIVQTSIPMIHHHYGFLTARYKINDIMNISASAIVDITAKSGIITAQYFYNILQNVNTILYLQYYPSSEGGLLPLPAGELTYGIRIEVAF
jgi:hypothetical protein